MQTKLIHYKKATRERLIDLLVRIGYKVTKQSTDGTWMLVRLPDGTPTNYWLFKDRVEHRLDDNRGGAFFSFKDCKFVLDGNETVAVIVKGSKSNSTFVQFHDFNKSHKGETSDE